ncbi:outer membrane beta-barrel protein, partial [Brevundimonas sp.]|uniref:outer membrane protein n=1 Tax=Brevundimonas sp. TaxID=1871086 RepID=UPI0025BE6376
MRVKTFILASSAAGALALSAGVAAAEPNGWYGAIDAGYHTIDDLELVSQNAGPQFNFEVEDSWAAFARLGYRFNENWRVELEGGYRDGGDFGSVTNANSASPLTGVCNLTPATGPCADPSGEIKSTTIMANVIYDFGDESWAFRPFIGLGAGVNIVNTEFIGSFGGFRTTSFGADDTSTKLAAQAIAGVAWAIGDRAHLDLTYRYLMSNMEFASFVSPVNATNTALTGDFAGRYDDSHTLTLGLRYAFGADEPAYIPP